MYNTLQGRGSILYIALSIAAMFSESWVPVHKNIGKYKHLKNFRVKDQRENSAYICHTERYMRLQCYMHDYSAIYATTVLYTWPQYYIESSYSTVRGLKQIGYVAPDLKIDAARTIQWRRNALEPKGKALQKFSIYAWLYSRTKSIAWRL